MKHGLTLLAAALLFAATTARADQVTLVSGKDNTLYQNAAGELSNGVGPTMFAGRTAQGLDDIRRALVFFDVAGSIPSGATITGARLKLFMSQTPTGLQTVTIYRLSESWGEGTSDAGPNGGSGAPSEPGDATWVHRAFDSSTWLSQGGTFANGGSASLGVTGIGYYTWGSTSQMVADVQLWLNNPAANHGWLIKGNEAAAPTAKRFDTRENPTAANRPTLIVDYTPPEVPVEATTWGRVKTLLD